MILINIALVIGFCAFLSFIVSIIIYFKEKHEIKKQDKSDGEYNQKMITMCLRSKQTGVCPGACAVCSWNTRKKNGVIEFRRK
jgi:hypothetical protein